MRRRLSKAAEYAALGLAMAYVSLTVLAVVVFLIFPEADISGKLVLLLWAGAVCSVAAVELPGEWTAPAVLLAANGVLAGVLALWWT
jgi:hypothetical protein